MKRFPWFLAAGVLMLSLSGCYSEGENDLKIARAALEHRQPHQAIRLTTRALRFGDLRWGAGKEYPFEGEDFAYMVFRKRNCCQGAF